MRTPPATTRRLPFPTGRLHTRDWNAERRSWRAFWAKLGL